MDEQQQSQVEADKLAKLEQQSQEHLEGWKRAKADYLNLKKQTEKEKLDIVGFATAQTVLSFLPIYDNLKRAVKHIPADQQELEWVKGIAHIVKQFEDSLRLFNITPIPTVGQPFDHAKHHAVSNLKQAGITPGTIVEEVKSGFMMQDRVIEPAQVIVAE